MCRAQFHYWTEPERGLQPPRMKRDAPGTHERIFSLYMGTNCGNATIFRIAETRASPHPKGKSSLTFLHTPPAKNITPLTNGYSQGYRHEWLFFFVRRGVEMSTQARCKSNMGFHLLTLQQHKQQCCKIWFQEVCSPACEPGILPCNMDLGDPLV